MEASGTETSDPFGANIGPAQPPEPPPVHEAESDPEPTDAIAALDARHAAQKAAAQAAAEELNDIVNRNREAFKAEYDESEQGAAMASHHEAERLMRLSTPDTLEALGAVVGDPLQGPSS